MSTNTEAEFKKGLLIKKSVYSMPKQGSSGVIGERNST